MRFFLPTLLLLALLTGCQDTPAESRFSKIASAYCGCTANLAALNRQAAALASDTTAQANFGEYLRKIQEEYAKAKECSASIISQYGKLRRSELDSVKAALTAKCPDLTEQGDLLQEMLGE